MYLYKFFISSGTYFIRFSPVLRRNRASKYLYDLTSILRYFFLQYLVPTAFFSPYRYFSSKFLSKIMLFHARIVPDNLKLLYRYFAITDTQKLIPSSPFIGDLVNPSTYIDNQLNPSTSIEDHLDLSTSIVNRLYSTFQSQKVLRPHPQDLLECKRICFCFICSD